MLQIEILNALSDNYIYLISGNNGFIAIDACDAALVQNKIKNRPLLAIFSTHNHFDHTEGNAKLKSKTNCKIYGPKHIPNADQALNDNDTIEFENFTIKAISTPGHTSNDMCYLIEADNDKAVFTGDTLFTGGCGRLFGGNAELMWDSLLQLASLPDNTSVYCGHEYTLENYEFALSIDPDNPVYIERLNLIKEQGVGVPSSIEEEKKSNIFLQSNSDRIKRILNMENAEDTQIFKEMRSKKDIC